MLIVKSWLESYLDKPISDSNLVASLEAAGIEVEGVRKVGDLDPKIVVAKIVELKKHPNADRLNLITLDTGASQIQIVTGAPNVKVGMKVPFAPVGTTLADGMVIKTANFRGVDSPGMACSAVELGIGEDHSGLLALDDELKPGKSLADIFGAETILDVKTAANRADLVSYIGLAREVAAQTGGKVKGFRAEAIDLKTNPRVHFENKVKDLVPRYMLAKVKIGKMAESPDWLKQRLELSGVRPLNLIVDITNYVMLETGQPLHAFEAAKTHGDVQIRSAKAAEKLETLDGKKRTLAKVDIVIADSRSAIGIAGVIGGENSAISDKTTMVLLESANFDGVTVRKTAISQGLRTEASARFERNLPVQFAALGMSRALELLKDLAGAKLEWVEDELNVWPWVQHIGVKPEHLSRLAGTKITVNQTIDSLEALGFAAEAFDIVAEAKKHLGKPYKFGANFKQDATNAFDCSYLIDYIYSLVGINVGHTALGQYELGQAIELKDLKPGDAVFYKGVIKRSATDHYYVLNEDKTHTKKELKADKAVGHNAIYIGNGKVIMAAEYERKGNTWVKRAKTGVVEVPLAVFTDDSDFLGARRFSADLGGYIAVTVPYWRSDVKLEEDIFEEVIKLVGLDKVPTTLPEWRLKDVSYDQSWPLVWDVRSLMVGLGLNEVVTYPFVSEQQLKHLDLAPSSHLKVANPRSVEQSYLRQSLLPGLLSALAANSIKEAEFGLFEIDNVFLPAKSSDLPKEEKRLAALIQTNGEAYARVKNVLDNLATALGLNFIIAPKSQDVFLKGRVAEIKLGTEVVGVIGQIDLKITKPLKIRGNASYLELNFEKLSQHLSVTKVRPVSRYQAIERDLTVILPTSVSWQMVVESLADLKDITLSYGGDYYSLKLGPDERALTLHIKIEPTKADYTEQAAALKLKQIADSLTSKFKASIE